MIHNNQDKITKALSTAPQPTIPPYITYALEPSTPSLHGTPPTLTSFSSVFAHLLHRVRVYRRTFLEKREISRDVALEYLKSCRDYRDATLPFLAFSRENRGILINVLGQPLVEQLEEKVRELRDVCRV